MISDDPEAEVMGDRKRIAVFELYPSNHSAGYLRALFSGTPADLPFDMFAVSALSAKNNPEIEEVLKEAASQGYCVGRIDAGEIRTANRLTLLFDSYHLVREAERFCQREKPDLAVILFLDLVLPWLAGPWARLLFPNLARQVSGIVFNGHAFRGISKKTVKKRLVDFWDRVFVRSALRSRHVVRLYFLDHDVVPKLQAAIPLAAPKIRPSVDPWTPFAKVPRAAGREYFSIEASDEFTVLTLGVHSPRKGTVWLLKAFEQLIHEDKEWRLVIAGPIRREVDQESRGLIERIAAAGGKVNVVNRFLSDSEVWKILQAIDIVACPYLDFWGSSNVLIRACAANKPVVASPDGVLEDVVRRFRCGEVIESLDTMGLVNALKTVKRGMSKDPTLYAKGCADYANFHTAQRFREQLAGESPRLGTNPQRL